MSRVLAVVERSIMVNVQDLRVNDIIYVRGDERDPIIEEIERDGDKVRLHYKDRPSQIVSMTLWMGPETGGKVFIHDLHNERKEFNDAAFGESIARLHHGGGRSDHDCGSEASPLHPGGDEHSRSYLQELGFQPGDSSE